MDYLKKKSVLSKIDECSTATDVVKAVNIHNYCSKVGCQDLVHG